MVRRTFKRLQDEGDDEIDENDVDHIELQETSDSNAHHQGAESSNALNHTGGRTSGGGGPSGPGPHGPGGVGHEAAPRRSLHQVEMDLEWPLIDIPQELREIQEDRDDSHTRSNSQANAIRNPFKRKLFLLLEDPSSSRTAFALNVWVSFAIVLSAVITTIETIPSFRTTDTMVWFGFETVMVAFFTIELGARIIAHSDSIKQLKRFLLSPLAIIDFLSIVPYYIELAVTQDSSVFFRFTILRLFRLLRVFRTFKYSSTIIMTVEVMIVAIKRSMDALTALFFFLITGTMLFSTLLYFAERGVWDEAQQVFMDDNGHPSTFDSIPSAFWFVMVTITTTGYGDMVPTTFIGKLISFPAMMCGILLITLPSIIIGRNFTLVWEAMQQYRRAAAHSREVETTLSTEVSRQSFDSRRSYEEPMRPGYSSLTVAGGGINGAGNGDGGANGGGNGGVNNSNVAMNQQELLDKIDMLTQVVKQNQQTMDKIHRLLESHELVPKRSPFEDSVVL